MNKKMDLTEQRDEWRNLAMQERQRANEAEAELAALRSSSWWQRHGGDLAFCVVAVMAAAAFFLFALR